MTYRAGTEDPVPRGVASSGELRHEELAAALEAVRARTLRLIEPLDDAVLHEQHSPLMSPLVWDLGHIANFEHRWLVSRLGEGGRGPAGTLDRIYDPFENPRSRRRELPFLRRSDVLRYLAEVREQVLEVLARQTLDPRLPLLRDGYVYWMIIQHESQHQETMLQSLDLHPTLAPYPPARSRPVGGAPPVAVDDRAEVHVAGGAVAIGTQDRVRAYDNERPRHVRHLAPFSIDRYPVTNRRYLEFVEDRGYERPALWSETGWRWREESGQRAPQGWRREDREWLVRRFGHRLALDPTAAVQHVCWHEAEAFARWAGGRLPSEHEWEATCGATGGEPRVYPWGAALEPDCANLGQTEWGPRPVGSYPRGASPAGAEQLLGDVYEWTSSRFLGYPGFESFPYREYSEVFFGDDYRVLRGASWATSPHCARTTFRNWDYPIRRQVFAGFRVARDA